MPTGRTIAVILLRAKEEVDIDAKDDALETASDLSRDGLVPLMLDMARQYQKNGSEDLLTLAQGSSRFRLIPSARIEFASVARAPRPFSQAFKLGKNRNDDFGLLRDSCKARTLYHEGKNDPGRPPFGCLMFLSEKVVF